MTAPGERKTARINFQLRPSLVRRIHVARAREGGPDGPMSLTAWVELAFEERLRSLGLVEAASGDATGPEPGVYSGGYWAGVARPPAGSSTSSRPVSPPVDPRLARLRWGERGREARWRSER